MSSFLSQRLADQVVVTISPRFVGGLPALDRGHGTRPGALPRLGNVRYQALGGRLDRLGRSQAASRRAHSEAANAIDPLASYSGLLRLGNGPRTNTLARLRQTSRSPWARFGYQGAVIEGRGHGRFWKRPASWDTAFVSRKRPERFSTRPGIRPTGDAATCISPSAN